MTYLFYLVYFLMEVVLSSDVGISPKNMAGFYTDGLENVEVVVPEKVTKDGAFVSHYLPHYYDVMSRPKRDSGSAIHFSVPINGKKQHLELWPHHSFLSPGLVIERRDVNAVENIRTANFKKLSRNQCHYSGQVIGEPKSRAALSTCNGLVGYIKMPNEEYLIEPIKDSKPTHGAEHPHIIYKRSDQKKKSKSNCGTHGSAREAFNERMEWESLNTKQNLDDTDEDLSMNNDLRGSDSKTTGIKNFEQGRMVNLNREQSSAPASPSRNSIFSTSDKQLDRMYKFSSNKNLLPKLNSKEKNLYEGKKEMQMQNNDNYKTVKLKKIGHITKIKKCIDNSGNQESNNLLNKEESKDHPVMEDRNEDNEQRMEKTLEKDSLDNFKYNNDIHNENDINKKRLFATKEESEEQDNNLFNLPVENNIINKDKTNLNVEELRNNEGKQNLKNTPKENNILTNQMNIDSSEFNIQDKTKLGGRVKRHTDQETYLNNNNFQNKYEQTSERKTRNIFNIESVNEKAKSSNQVGGGKEELETICKEEKVKGSKIESGKNAQESREAEQNNLNANYDSVLSIKEKRANNVDLESYLDYNGLTSEDESNINNKQNKNRVQSEIDLEQSKPQMKNFIKPEKSDFIEDSSSKIDNDARHESITGIKLQPMNDKHTDMVKPLEDENVKDFKSKCNIENSKTPNLNNDGVKNEFNFRDRVSDSRYVKREANPKQNNTEIEKEKNINKLNMDNSSVISESEKDKNINKLNTDNKSVTSETEKDKNINKLNTDNKAVTPETEKENILNKVNTDNEPVTSETEKDKNINKINNENIPNKSKEVAMKTEEKSINNKENNKNVEKLISANTKLENNKSNEQLPPIINSETESVMYETPCIGENEMDTVQDKNISNESEEDKFNVEYGSDYDPKIEDVDLKVNTISTDMKNKETSDKENVRDMKSENVKREMIEEGEKGIYNENSKSKRKVENKDPGKLSEIIKNKVGCKKNAEKKSFSNVLADKDYDYLNEDTKDEQNFANSQKEDKNQAMEQSKISIKHNEDSEDDNVNKDILPQDTVIALTDNFDIHESQEHNIGNPIKENTECVIETTTEGLHCSDYYTKQYNIEIMITIDHKVLELHSEDDVEIFILTITNMVASNFYDASIGINMNVVLVRLILLTNCIKQLDVDVYSPAEILENFCAWQVQINPTKDRHPNHHDLAIFVTRMQQCEGQVLGVAYMTSLCRPDKSCIVCVDEGLLLANIMTHQIGHSLGAEHDEGQNNGCPDSEPDGTTYHMGPNIRQTSSAWSVCSRESIIQFIRTRASWCLTDSSTDHDFKFPLMLPGQIYSASQQCKLNFQMLSSPCVVGKFCEKLYCQISPTECVTKGDPPADGTFCAADMWCFKKDCVTVGRRPGAINGEWGKWSDWTQCTRTCGGGVSMSYRICNNPKPSKGGRYCVGKRIRHKMCAIMPCQGFTQSFRDLQCKKTEDRPFRGRYHNWQRYDSFFHNIECSLVCLNRKGEIVMRSPVAIDGTPCRAGTRNVCIQGACVNVGCDWVIDSNAKEDSCGTCHGNGTGCRIIQGFFDEPSKEKTIIPFLQVPKGSGMIFVREVAPSYNLLAVSGAINQIFYLNGQGTHEDPMPGDMVFGLTHGTYEIRSNMERLFIRGPTSEPLVFHAVFNDVNRGIRYQYAIPDFDPTYMPRYQWQFIDWDPCTDPCSGGAQRSHAKCVEDRGGIVDDCYCIANTRPMDVIRPCNEFPCKAKWWVSIWSDCICTGTVSIMFRSVLCMRTKDNDATRAEVVKESECSDHIKPVSHKPCNDSNFIPDCSKRAINSEQYCGSNSSQLNSRPLRSVAPKLYPTKENDPLKNTSQETPTSKSESIQETGTKSPQLKLPLRDRSSFNNRLADRNPSLFNMANDIPSRTLSKVKGAADKLQKRIHVNAEANRKQGMVVNKGLGRNQQNGKFSESGLSRMNETVGIIQKNQLQTNGNGVKSNNSNAQSKYLQNKFEKNSAENEDEDSTETESSSTETSDSTESNESAEHSSKNFVITHVPEDLCESTTALEGPCETAPPTTPSTTTCLITNRPAGHKKTTCCKKIPTTHPSRNQMKDVIMEEPTITKVDQLNLNNFGITVVPYDTPKRKLPQTDAEYTNLGEVGLFNIGSDSNGTEVIGQDAIDLLERARENVTQLPPIQHEEVDKKR